ncbi:MAG: imidazole glycerol phosphate synthase subunit HisH, partial [Lentibacter algarum]
MLTAIVDYDSGNLHSAHKAFERMAHEMGAGDVIVTSDPETVLKADRVVLPGDGAFPACHKALFDHKGIFEALQEVVIHRARPFMGICIGMQMLATRGLEYEETMGFDWIKGEVRKIIPSDPTLRVPHMGWNALDIEHDHPLFSGVTGGKH